MRRRVEEHVPADGGRRASSSSGRGGLRDVEFSVQLLQLVHGRADEALRSSGTTLEALARAAAGGYVGRDDAAALADAYRLLRTLEHRIQLFRLRRTHLMPTDGRRPAPARPLGRAPRATRRERAGRAQWQAARARGPAAAREAVLPSAAAGRRPAVTGGGAADPRGGARAAGGARLPRPDRRAAPHRGAHRPGSAGARRSSAQLLPVMLGWFADAADPDAGLLAFRRVSETLGTTHWYLKLLRDAGTRRRAARARAGPQPVRRRRCCSGRRRRSRCSADDAGLEPAPARGAAAPRRSRRHAARRARSTRRRRRPARSARRELFRIAAADVLGAARPGRRRARADRRRRRRCWRRARRRRARCVEAELGGPLPTRLLVVGDGPVRRRARWATAATPTCCSCTTRSPGPTSAAARRSAHAGRRTELRRLLGGRRPGPAAGARRRPAARGQATARWCGPCDSYAAYYERWSLVWEAQALLRATPGRR